MERLVSVTNDGPYPEDVYLEPRNLLPGAKMTISPRKMRIRGKSRGLFRVRAELEERLLDAACGKDIPVVLDAWRQRDHNWDRWGATKIVYKPRLATSIALDLNIVPGEGVRLVGAVTPDIGGESLRFHIVLPNQDPFWITRSLGPAATFNFVVDGPLETGELAVATAYFDGNDDYARSASKTVSVTFTAAG